jgi:hypothetical protein
LLGFKLEPYALVLEFRWDLKEEHDEMEEDEYDEPPSELLLNGPLAEFI